MGHTYYAKLWLDAREDLEKIIEYDEIIKENKPIEDRAVAESLILEFYFRYRNIVQRLTVCHDQIVQPQIRDFIQKMLDYTIIRMLEFRREMVNYSSIDYPWPVDILIEFRWTLDDMDLSAPVYNAHTKQIEFNRRKILFEKFLAKKRQVDESNDELKYEWFESNEGEEEELQSIEEEKEKSNIISAVVVLDEPPEIDQQEVERKAFYDAILLIQSNERARVGRQIAINVVRQLLLRQRLGSGDLLQKKVDQEEQVRAAVVIQKTWRGFSTRRKIEQKKRKFEELLYMAIPSKGNPQNILKRIKKCLDHKSKQQAMALRALEEMIIAEDKRIRDVRGPTLVEDIRDEIRVWFFEWFERLGFFDYIPAAEAGGSVLVATGQTRTPEEYFSSLSEKDAKKTNETEPEEEEEKTEEEEITGWKMQESNVVQLLLDVNKEFVSGWSDQMEKILNPTGPLIHDFIYADICHKIQLDMREIADESMRIELENFNAALKLDHAGEEYALPNAQEFSAVVEEEHPETELLPDSTEDELLIELMHTKVIHDHPECYLRDWPGVPSYALRGNNEIRLGDIKQAVMDYCVFPIGSKAVHELAPFVRSVCICGPPGSGQLFIARAICTELKATVFDLSPQMLKGRYKSKESQDRLVQAIFKLAKAHPPSVVLVEGEMAWLKRVPPELMRLDAKRFVPVYKKIIDNIKPGDQVLFLTASTQPYLANKSFVKLFDKFIIIPVADYGTTYLAYKKSLMSQHAIPRHFNVSSLAKVIANETPLEFAQNALNECIKIERRMDYKRRPLRQMEILDTLQSDVNRPTKKELALFDKFRSQLPMEKRRVEILQEILEA